MAKTKGKTTKGMVLCVGVLVNVNTIICLRRANILIKYRDNGCTVASGTKAWVCRQKTLGLRINDVIGVVAAGLAKIDQGKGGCVITLVIKMTSREGVKRYRKSRSRDLYMDPWPFRKSNWNFGMLKKQLAMKATTKE